MSRNFELMEAVTVFQESPLPSQTHGKANQDELRHDGGQVPRKEASSLTQLVRSIFATLRGLNVHKPHRDCHASSVFSALEAKPSESSSTMSSAKLRLASTSDGRKLSVYSLVRHL